MRMESISERQARLMAEHERRTAGERRKAFWAGKAASEVEGERRLADRRASDRNKAADSRAVGEWIAR